MAEEWWSSARPGGDHASAYSTTSPATAESASSRPTNSVSSLQPAGLPDSGAGAATSFFLEDPHMDWAQTFMQGKGEEAEQPSSLTFNALLQLQGDASHQFLLDQAPVLPYSVSDGATAVVAASQQGVSSFYEDSQQQQQQQQFPSFFSSSGLFGAPAQGSSPPLFLQAPKPKPLKSSTTTEPVVQDACSSSATRRGSPAAAKRPRVETPSTMPTFKVRKEKLGDRITALQQLVSPFGKTDTASVLHEAIGYIKFLHDQVASLSSPYFIKCSGRPVQLQHKLGSDNDGGDAKEDLRSRGLCLIPVASTYAVASEIAPEFWHPTFGGTFR
ncbi:unnamed protein product [Alopecurus aequalis]